MTLSRSDSQWYDERTNVIQLWYRDGFVFVCQDTINTSGH